MTLTATSPLSTDALTYVLTFLPLSDSLGVCPRVSKQWQNVCQSLESFICSQSRGSPICSKGRLLVIFRNYMRSLNPNQNSRLSIFFPPDQTMISVQCFNASFQLPAHSKQLTVQLPSANEEQLTQRISSTWLLNTSEKFSICAKIDSPTDEKTLRIRKIFDQLAAHARIQDVYANPDSIKVTIDTASYGTPLSEIVRTETPPGSRPWYVLALAILSIIFVAYQIFPSIGLAVSSALNF